ncbi:MAG TPA: PQQ-binding-like beta-propeller repeat protein [Planctomycetota bacterium]|nr:PQQ-binding-like beta-propeller repeat protein [Planctomycetota bacterium]
MHARSCRLAWSPLAWGRLALPGLLLALSAWAPGQSDDSIAVAETDWPWWRGTARDGSAPERPKPPLSWSETEHVLWKAEVPGRGHGSPAVFGDRVYLAACDESTGRQSVLAFDRATGRRLWETEVHPEGAMRKNAKSSGASTTPACDGERVFITFPNRGAVVATALGLDGKILWQTKISDYVIHQGYGSSPAPYRSLVLVSADHHGGGVIMGLDRKTGQVVWRHDRPKAPNYSSPVVLKADGRDQLIMTGCDLVTSLDPMTGKVLWETPGATTECVTSTVTDGTHVFPSGGYPRNHLAAVRADGSGKVDWETKDRVYVPSLLVREGYLYGVLDAGVAVCWACDTGREMWKARLGGTFSASPVRVGDTVYATNEAGLTFVFRARPDQYTPLGSSQLGSEVLATPAIGGGRLYMRVAEKSGGRRQEWLYCLGENP